MFRAQSNPTAVHCGRGKGMDTKRAMSGGGRFQGGESKGQLGSDKREGRTERVSVRHR